jgi:hypothetical protein
MLSAWSFFYTAAEVGGQLLVAGCLLVPIVSSMTSSPLVHVLACFCSNSFCFRFLSFCNGQQGADIGGDVGCMSALTRSTKRDQRTQLRVLRATAGASVIEEHGDVRAQLSEQWQDVDCGGRGALEDGEGQLRLARVQRKVVVHCLQHNVDR